MPSRTDDEFLIRFLRSRFFKLEHVYNLVRAIYTLLFLEIDSMEQFLFSSQMRNAKINFLFCCFFSVVPILRIS